MRNRALHDALLAFSEEAALQLSMDAADGAEVPFEVIEGPGARSPLYCYRPLTDSFIGERIDALAQLPTYLPAAHALAGLDGLAAYLRIQAPPPLPEEPRVRADAALRAFLGRMFDEATEFVFTFERFRRAYGELEAAVYQGRAVATVIAPVLGLELESDQIALGEGLSLERGDRVEDAPAEAVWATHADSERPSVLAVLTVESSPGHPSPVTEARLRFRRLLTGLRLFDTAGLAMGPVGWARDDAGAWRLVVLGGSGRAHGAPHRISAEQEDELRAFCSLVARRIPAGGEVAWALARFEMGCERLAPFDALTDYLLALRALLEPEGPASGRLAQRLAAICALPDERAALAERVAHAISLERALVAGLAPAGPGPDALVGELGMHLRALLRDVLCGHLDSDLRTVADDLLADAVAGAQGVA